MLGLQKSICLHGLPKHPDIMLSSKISSRSFATVISTRRDLSIFNKGVAALPTHNSKSTAAFSSHSHGLRKLLYLNDPWSPEMKALDPHKARIAFIKTNPFNDAAAHNCCLRFKGAARHDDDYTDGKTVIGWFDREIDILQDELKKLVRLAKEADNTDEWPMVMMFNELRSLWPTGTFEIVFKVPGRFEPQSFFWRLRDLNLENGEFVTAEGVLSQSVDRWWHRFLYCLPEEQKYWLHHPAGPQAASSVEVHRTYKPTRQATVRDRQGLRRKPAISTKNRSHITSTFGPRSKRPMLSAPLAHEGKFATAFSTQPSGLRKAIWTELDDLVPCVNPEALRFVFASANPFSEDKAHKCMLWFLDEAHVFNPESKLANPHLAMLLLQKEMDVVQDELNKIVKPDHEWIPEWPVVLGLRTIMGRTTINIIFKVPSKCDPKDFEKRLRQAGLEQGRFEVMPTLRHDWWHTFCFCIPKEQQYWSLIFDGEFQAIPARRAAPTAAEKAARRFFKEHDPFDDPNDRNCIISRDDKPTTEHVESRIAILKSQLANVLASPAKAEGWPVVKIGARHALGQTHILFKVPSIETLKAFEARLRTTGIDGGKFQEVGRAWDQSWYNEIYEMYGVCFSGFSGTTGKIQTTPPEKKHRSTTGPQTAGRNQGGRRPDLKHNNNDVGKRSYATVSKDHSTKPTLVIEYRTIPVEEKEAAAATWDTINPFNESLARNCALIIENAPLIRNEDGKLEHTATHRQFDTQSGLVLDEMGKVLKAAGNQAHWPTLGLLQDARIPHQNLPYDFHIYFRLPPCEELESFEARLRKAGLEGGYLEDLGREFDKWWHATLWGMAKGGFSIPADMNARE